MFLLSSMARPLISFSTTCKIHPKVFSFQHLVLECGFTGAPSEPLACEGPRSSPTNTVMCGHPEFPKCSLESAQVFLVFVKKRTQSILPTGRDRCRTKFLQTSTSRRGPQKLKPSLLSDTFINFQETMGSTDVFPFHAGSFSGYYPLLLLGHGFRMLNFNFKNGEKKDNMLI